MSNVGKSTNGRERAQLRHVTTWALQVTRMRTYPAQHSAFYSSHIAQVGRWHPVSGHFRISVKQRDPSINGGAYSITATGGRMVTAGGYSSQ